MTRIAELDNGLQAMRGGYASLRGQTYNVYRLSSATPSTGILTGTAVLTNFQLAFRRTSTIAAIEGTIFDLICLIGMCDNRQLQIGDVLVENGYEGRPNAIYTFVQARPSRESLFIRTEFVSTIGNPLPHDGQAAQQPSSGWTVGTGYGGSDDANVASVQLASGAYLWGAAGSAGAQIPCGVAPINRLRDGSELGTPNDLTRAHFVAYIPDLGSSAPLERNDRILTPNATYQVLSFTNSAGPGVWGNVCFAEQI